MQAPFDELELLKGPEDGTGPVDPILETGREPQSPQPASRWRRCLAFATDLSLFLALGLALTPLLRIRETWGATLRLEWPALVSMLGFILLISFYYFVICWTIWGKTVGGSIFDLHMVDDSGTPIDIRSAAWRWLGTLASLLLLGGGFLPALLPSGRSLADRLSHSHQIVAV